MSESQHHPQFRSRPVSKSASTSTATATPLLDSPHSLADLDIDPDSYRLPPDEIDFRPANTELIPIPTNPNHIFDALIDQNHRVCKHCYRRVRTTYSVPHHVGSNNHLLARFIYEGDAPDESRFQYLDTPYYEAPTISGRMPRLYPEEPDRANKLRGRRACWNCAVIDTERRTDTRSLADACQAGEALSITIAEYGIEHCPQTLNNRILRYKRQNEYNGDDQAVFRAAVADAIRVRRDSDDDHSTGEHDTSHSFGDRQ